MGHLPPICVPRGASGYPVRLEHLARPPAELWVAGRLPTPGQRAVAIVGARAATAAAVVRARQLATALARRGVAIVSGGAHGIDAAAHEGALAADGVTFAVLGCGVDVVYPDRHRELFASIAVRGGMLSEYAPGTKPRPGQFPARNRLIAALADLVIVVEANWRSGALSTAAEARRLNRPVLASPGSPGTDRLIARGQAGAPVHEEAGAEGVWALLVGRPVPVRRQLGLVCTASFGPLVVALDERADTAEGLSARLTWPLAKVMSELGLAEIEGWIRRAPGGAYEVTRGH